MIVSVPRWDSLFPAMVIIPARDETESVGGVVRDVSSHVDWEVVVVDDASTDDTAAEAANAGAQVLQMPFRVGAWGAVQVGMAYALGKGYELALTMDADGQHLAEMLPLISEPVFKGSSDVAIGVCPERVSSARHVAWGMFKSITGLNLQDMTSGMRAYNADAMRVLVSKDAAMLSYQDIGVLLMLRETGMRIGEIKVEMRARRSGHSRVYDSWWTVSKYLVETIILSTVKWRPSWHLGEMNFTSSRNGAQK